MTDRQDLETLLRSLKGIYQSNLTEVRAILEKAESYSDAEHRKAFILESFLILAKDASTIGGEIGARWYEEQRAVAGIDDGWRAWPREGITSEAAREHLTGLLQEDQESSELKKLAAKKISGYARNAARNTIAYSAIYDRHATAFARVPRGKKTCAFCTLLSSRGWVYTDPKQAGYINTYHSNCDCLIVPSWRGRIPAIERYNPERLERHYHQAREAAIEEYGIANPTDVHILERMRAVPNRYTDSRVHDGGFTKEEKSSGSWRIHEAYWKARQDALKSIIHDDQLYPWEIQTIERLERLGHRVEWISRDPRRISSNDFIWLTEDGVSAETKSTSAKYETIKKRIQGAVKAAAKHDIVKDVFLIDIGKRRLSEKLRKQVAAYNDRVQSGKIKQLYVLSEYGEKLERII